MTLGNNIKRRVNQYLKEKLGMYDYRKGWLKGDCPYCGDHKFGVNLYMNRSNCFKCGNHPGPMDMITELEGFLTTAETINFLTGFDGLDYYEEIVEPYQLKETIVLPDGYKNIIRGKSKLAETARNYVRKRGFNIKRVSRAGWGYCTKGKYLGYLIMPFYLKGRIVYFNARLFIGDGPKFNNPDIDDFGIGKSMLMYNMDALGIYKTIYLVESLMNARTIGDNGVGTGGKKVSNYQLNAIIKSPCERVIIGLDDDAIDDAIALALKLQPHKRVKVMQFPEGKDINDLGKKKSLKIARKARYLEYNDILKLKFSL